jgi:hypothetical protein
MKTSGRNLKTIPILLGILLYFSAADVAIAQAPGQVPRQTTAGDEAAGCACCGSMLLMIVLPIVLIVLYFAINVAILFWVAKDAKSRGMDGAMWIFLILFTGVVGLAIYLFSRPQGLLIQCEKCGNNRMEVSAKCPHCGHR